jgi:hypothetical protein
LAKKREYKARAGAARLLNLQYIEFKKGKIDSWHLDIAWGLSNRFTLSNNWLSKSKMIIRNKLTQLITKDTSNSYRLEFLA